MIDMRELNKEYFAKLPSPVGRTKEEIVNTMLSEEYGFLPEIPFEVTGRVIDRDNTFCAGKAFLEKIEVRCRTIYGDFHFPIFFTCPKNASEPVPAVIHINYRDLVPDKYEPSEEIVDAGFAVLSFNYENICQDDAVITKGFGGYVYPDGKRKPDQCGKIGLWAWAASRVMDYALQRPELDHDCISVAGHSRLGKTALVVGATDDRFFCTYSNDSGCSGAALSRGKRGQNIARIYSRLGFWFCQNYAKYMDKEDEQDFDQHFLIAAIAPKRCYIGSSVGDLWSDPDKEYEACVAASCYYEAMGVKGFVHPDRMAEPGEQFGEGLIGFHLRAGDHYFSREDWKLFLKYVTDARNEMRK